MDVTAELPICALRQAVSAAVQTSPIVLTAPTGTGKSTEVPQWLAAFGRVLVIEPRRVACRSLASRVADITQTRIGDQVGYVVRGERRATDSTRITYVTPGVALRYYSRDRWSSFEAVMLDEFHERTLEIDLLAALLRTRYPKKQLITSATIHGDTLASWFDGVHLTATGSLYDVDIQYLPMDNEVLPTARQLTSRVAAAVNRALTCEGDILVFLPGKPDIAQIAAALEPHRNLQILPFHGSLSLDAQAEVFRPHAGRRVILSTNVAETSVTIPGIGVVIDSGLVKRTRYVGKRGFLTLVPIAKDSAAQRAGRAGRTSAGVCFRMWSPRALLEPETPPEIQRESLTPLLLACAACGESIHALPFVTPPRKHALQAAIDELMAFGAMDEELRITDRGRRMFSLPVAPPMARFLLESESRGCLVDALDLVAMIGDGQEVFRSDTRPLDPNLDLRRHGCDVTAFIHALRKGDPQQHDLDPRALKEARSRRRELAAAFSIAPANDTEPFRNRDLLSRCAVAAIPDCAHVIRKKKKQMKFSNGSREIELSSKSAANPNRVEAIVVLASMAHGLGYRDMDARIVATCATPVSLSMLAESGLGEWRMARPCLDQGRVEAVMECVYANTVLHTVTEVPRGTWAVECLTQLFVEGRIHASIQTETAQRLEQAQLVLRINAARLTPTPLDSGEYATEKPGPVSDWIRQRLTTLGIETGDDLRLLSETDLLPPPLPEETATLLLQKFPVSCHLGDVTYAVNWDFQNRQVTLTRTGGTRKTPPSFDILPSFSGFAVVVKHHTQSWTLRRRR